MQMHLHPASRRPARPRRTRACLAIACGLLLPLLVPGCGVSTPASAEARFTARIAELLRDRDSAVVTASDLSDFRWQALCFRREEQLLLTFKGSDPAIEFRFDYTDYFVDEPYVAQSPADRCIAHDDRIVIRKKYPKHAGTIEFQLPG